MSLRNFTVLLIDMIVHHSKFLVIKLHTDCGISTKEREASLFTTIWTHSICAGLLEVLSLLVCGIDAGYNFH